MRGFPSNFFGLCLSKTTFPMHISKYFKQLILRNDFLRELNPLKYFFHHFDKALVIGSFLPQDLASFCWQRNHIVKKFHDFCSVIFWLFSSEWNSTLQNHIIFIVGQVIQTTNCFPQFLVGFHLLHLWVLQQQIPQVVFQFVIYVLHGLIYFHLRHSLKKKQQIQQQVLAAVDLYLLVGELLRDKQGKRGRNYSKVHFPQPFFEKDFLWFQGEVLCF